MNNQTDAMPTSYEIAVDELEQLVGRMEGGELSLEESLAAYRRGSALVAYCRQQLEKVEQKVRVLDGDMLKPFVDVDGEAMQRDASSASTEDGF